MILQNLTKAIREQNWFAVVVEFLIVIAGVVIGFQIQGWSEERASKNEAQQLLTRLHQEVVNLHTIQTSEYSLQLPRVERLMEVHPLLFDEVPGRDLTDAGCLQIAISHWMPSPTDDLPVLEEAISTNRFDLIADEELRAQLRGFILVRERARRQYGEETNELFRMPSRHPDSVWYIRAPRNESNQSDRILPVQRSETQWDRRAGEGQRWAPQCDLENMRNNRAFRSEYIDNVSRLNSFVERYEESIDLLMELESVLAMELSIQSVALSDLDAS